jgi:hypothetical protein
VSVPLAVTVCDEQGLIHSDFIKDLLDLPSSQSIDEAPIQVHQTANIVRRFVDCINSSPEHDPQLKGADLGHFIELCDHLQASAIKSSVLRRVTARLSDIEENRDCDAWEIFKCAAKQDNVALAKLAIGNFDKSGVKLRDMFASEAPLFFDDMPPQYVYALLRCFVNPQHTTTTLNQLMCPSIVFKLSGEAASDFKLK